MPLYAAICRSLERKPLIFLRLGFVFASQLRWRSAARAKLAREPEGATLKDAIDSGSVKIAGSQAKLEEMLSYLDSFDFWFNIVTP
jgi:hypothetical protein